MHDLYQLSFTDITGKTISLKDYEQQVMLIVNTASRCGFTPQYEGLEALYTRYASRGFVVLGFPCDQFLHQEPGNESEIAEFCRIRYGVSFPLSQKVEVNGPNTHPIFQKLKAEAPGVLGSKRIKWNFTKFLVNRGGSKIKRFAPSTKPEKLQNVIEAWINE
ncbi:MAG: glutathione peroxidase [Gammaproteobacteria bacterium]|nr:MAG: glutathione peroxidase [Gammaproteobacteria bacterium]